MARVLTNDYGLRIERPTRGSHWKVRRPDGRMYTLPCGNGERTELSDKYIKGLCRSLGIPFDELKGKL